MARQMVEAARARDDRLVGCQPRIGSDPFGNQSASFDVRGLNIDCPDAELFVSKKTFELAHPVMFDKV